MPATKQAMIPPFLNKKNSNSYFYYRYYLTFLSIIQGGYSMQIILSQEQIREIQILLANLIRQEIDNRLHKSGIRSPYLNKKQACEYLGISNNTLDSWIKKGLPIIRVGKTVRFNTDDLNQWLQNF